MHSEAEWKKRVAVGKDEGRAAHLSYWVTTRPPFPLPAERKNRSSQDEKRNMRKVLECRENALSFLKKEKRRVDSLLRLCETVKHLIKGDILEDYNPRS